MEIKKILWILIAISFVNSAEANVIGTNFQTFNPTQDGLDYVTVESSLTLDPGVANFGFFCK